MKAKLIFIGFIAICNYAIAQNVRTSESLSGLVYFSPDGKSLLSTSGQFFDLRTGKTAADLNYKGTDQNGAPTYFEAAFSPTGNLIVYNRKVFDGNSLQNLFELPERQAFSRHLSTTEKHFSKLKDLDACAFSADEKRVLAADEIFDISTKKIITTLKPTPYKAGLNYLHLAGNTTKSISREISVNPNYSGFESNYTEGISPDLKYLISGESLKDETIGFLKNGAVEASEEYDAKQDLLHLHYSFTAELITKAKLSKRFEDDKISYSLVGNLAAIADDRIVKIFDASTGKLKTKIENKFDAAWDFVVLSASGKLVLAGEDNNVGIFSAENGKLVRYMYGGDLQESDNLFERRTIYEPVFSFDDKFVINGTDGAVFEIATGKILAKVPFFNTKIEAGAAYLTANNKAIYQYTDGSARVFDATTGNELFTQQISNPNTLFFAASDNGKWYAATDWQGNLSLWNDQSETPVKTWSAHQGLPISQLVFDTPNNQFYTYGFDNKVNTWNLSNLSLISSASLAKPINQLYAVGDNLLASTSTELHKLDYETGELEAIFEFYGGYEKPMLRFHPKTNMVLVANSLYDFKLKHLLANFDLNRAKDVSWDKVMGIGTTKKEPAAVYTITGQKQISRWDLTNGQVSLVKFKANSEDNQLSTNSFDRVHSQPDFSKIVSAGTGSLYDFDKKSFYNPFYGVLKYPTSVNDYMHISADGKYITNSVNSNKNNRILNIYNAANGALISSIDAGENTTILRGFFSVTGDTVYFGYDLKSDDFLAIADSKTGKILKQIALPFEAKDILPGANGKWVAVSKGWSEMLVYDNTLINKLMEFKLPFVSVNSYLVASPNGKQFVLTEQEGFKGGEAAIINVENKTVRQIPGLHYHVNFSADNKYLISTLKDSKADADFMTIYRTDNLQKITTHMQMGVSDKSLIYTPERFYMASKDAINEVHFSEGKKTFLFDQFDLRFNRPDLVLKVLGYADAATLTAYKKAWEKRVRKMGFDPKLFDGFETKLNTPELSLVSEIPTNTTQASVMLSFTATDKLFAIERLHIYANGVPVFGSKGKAVKTIGKKTANGFELAISETVELLPGNNTVEVSVTNEQGIESLRERFQIHYKANNVAKPDLYIVSIGVSNFKNTSMNLTYAAKDANDFVDLFTSNKEKYNQIHVLTFLNNEAYRERILEVKNQLLKSKIGDEVLVFVASHGLLDENIDYYIAMHDMVFENPSARGLKYEDLENLLDGIPARQKLMFIDACHSGEVDKEESELVASETKNTNGVSSRGFKTVQNKNGIGLKTSFELMKELFADLRRGSGTIVISSASGKEFAYESDVWKNGVFTYALIEGIKSGNADKDKHSGTTVSELQKYVSQKVFELTNGKQNPTSRTEKLDVDFRVW